MKEKEKGLHELGPAHNEAGPTVKIQKRNPPGEVHPDLNTLHQEPDLFQNY